jgi:Protein of unknown function (DUF3237)
VSAVLEFVFEVRAIVDAPLIIGPSSRGLRRVIPILGGVVAGPRLNGEIVPGGADWQYVRPDGVLSLEARYTLRANDGALIQVINRGMRHGPEDVMARVMSGEPVAPDAYYFRTVAEFEAPIGVHDWLNKAIFVGVAQRRPDAAIVQFHRVN